MRPIWKCLAKLSAVGHWLSSWLTEIPAAFAGLELYLEARAEGLSHRSSRGIVMAAKLMATIMAAKTLAEHREAQTVRDDSPNYYGGTRPVA